MVGTFTRSPAARRQLKGLEATWAEPLNRNPKDRRWAIMPTLIEAFSRALKIVQGANCLARLAKRGNHVKIHYFSPHRLPAFCKAMNTSYADPPIINTHWSLKHEIHCGAILLPPSCRATAAT